MPRKKNPLADHTGRTDSGHTRDVKVERVGKVTIYKRGDTYYLYYRQGGISQRRRIDGNLAVARATAHKVMDALSEGRPSPIAYTRTSPDQLLEGFLDAATNVQKLALRTQDRYRAALNRFTDFCRAARVGSIDSVQEATVEEFVKFLRGQKRNRNGSAKGKKDVYQTGGIKFILSTCRTAFNWATRRRMLPPFGENPFTRFPIDQLRDTAGATKPSIFSPHQEKSFFAACSPWQHSLFFILATYGLRLGELTHLLVEDIDLANDVLFIRSKPELFWQVKTGRERQLPLLPLTRPVFEQAIAVRAAGFVFLNADYSQGHVKPAMTFPSPLAFRMHLRKVVADLRVVQPDADEKAQRRAVVAFCRSMGQIPEKRVRGEFLKLTEQIGCPEFTRVHDLRHLFSSRAQAAGINPILVQNMLGHTTLDMTKRYTHLDINNMRDALEKLSGDNLPPAANHG